MQFAVPRAGLALETTAFYPCGVRWRMPRAGFSGLKTVGFGVDLYWMQDVWSFGTG